MEFNFSHIQFLLPTSSTLVIIVAILYIMVKGKHSLLQLSFISLLVVIFFWTFGQVLQYISGNDVTTRISILFIQTSISFIAFSWLLFVFVYTNNPVIYNRKILFWLSVLPGLSWVTLLTNDYHHLLFTYLRYAPHELYNIEIR